MKGFRAPAATRSLTGPTRLLPRRLRRTGAGLVWVTALALAMPESIRAQTCPPTAQLPSAEQLQQLRRQPARDRGFLWRIGKDGRSSYLYGTIHLGRIEWIFPGPAVTRALGETDTLALELDPSDPQTARDVRIAAGRQAGEVSLPSALQSRLQRQVELACLPTGALATVHPVMQTVTLAALAGRWDGLDPAYAQEAALAGHARASQRQVLSLETPELQVAALVPEEADRAQAVLDQALDQLETGRLRRQLGVLADVWERGDLDRLQRYESWCDCVRDDEDRSFLRRLNDDRNPGLADRIDVLHREGRRAFAAVGALHLTGPQALPALMRQRGYEVERVPFGP